MNAPGTIDADYRGEVKVLLINLGQEPFTIERNERIAQMVFKTVPAVEFVEVDELSDTVRGAGGFDIPANKAGRYKVIKRMPACRMHSWVRVYIMNLRRSRLSLQP